MTAPDMPTFFHGGTAGLSPGDLLTPLGQQPPSGRRDQRLKHYFETYTHMNIPYMPDVVFVTTWEGMARSYATSVQVTSGKRGAVYVVEPQEFLMPDPDFAGELDGYSFITPAATVLQVKSRQVQISDREMWQNARLTTRQDDGSMQVHPTRKEQVTSGAFWPADHGYAGQDLHELQRDLARRKPFNRTGKGFRDTLVWETTKQVVGEATAGDTIFLVTDNHGDYCDESGAVAPELLAEVEGAAGELLRVADLGELLGHSKLKPMVAGLAKTDEQLATFLALAEATQGADAEPLPVDQVVKNAVINAVEQLAGEEVKTLNPSTSGFDFTELGIPDEIEGLTIDVVAPDESTLSWQTYETYQDTTLLIQAEIHAEVSLTGFVYKSDLGYVEGEGEAGKVQVLEWDWNDHMVHVSTTASARLIFQIRLEQGHDSVEECELEGAQPLTDDDTHPWKGPA